MTTVDHSAGDRRPLTDEERHDLTAVARYQFGHAAGPALIEAAESATHRRSGRVDRLYRPSGRVATLTTAGRFTLGLEGGRAIHAAVAAPDWRVIVDAEARPFVADGETAFAKFVVDLDPAVRPYDEVVVVDEDDTLLAVGRATLSARGAMAFEKGDAVDVRAGIDG